MDKGGKRQERGLFPVQKFDIRPCTSSVDRDRNRLIRSHCTHQHYSVSAGPTQRPILSGMETESVRLPAAVCGSTWV